MMDMYALLMGGGSGGGLPTPTAADVGKTMMVQAIEAEGDVIVPEQTVAYDTDWDYFMPVLNVDTDKFTDGTKAKLIINDDSYVGIITEGYIGNGDTGDTMGFFYDLEAENWVAYYTPDGGSPESITIKVVAIAETYQWTPTNPYLICRLDPDTERLDHTYKEIIDAMKSGTIVLAPNTNMDYDFAHVMYITRGRLVNSNYLLYVDGNTGNAMYDAGNSIDNYPLFVD